MQRMKHEVRDFMGRHGIKEIDFGSHSLKAKKLKLTPMQQFTVDLLKKEKNGTNPNHLATLWAEHTTGRSRAASRDRFGYTSAAYKTMRKLADMGVIVTADRYLYKLKK